MAGKARQTTKTRTRTRKTGSGSRYMQCNICHGTGRVLKPSTRRRGAK